MNKKHAWNRHLLTGGEVEFLELLRNKELGTILADVVDVYLITAGGPNISLSFLPGVGASPFDSREELIRIAVAEAEPAEVQDVLRSKFLQTFDISSKIECVEILNSYIVFADKENLNPESSSIISINGGPTYSVRPLDPCSLAARSIEKDLIQRGLLNEVDVGIYLTLDSGTALAISTSGFSAFLTVYSVPAQLGDLFSGVRRLPLSMRKENGEENG